MKKLKKIASIFAVGAALFGMGMGFVSCSSDDGGNDNGGGAGADPVTLIIDENDTAKGFVETSTGTKVNTANVTGYSGSGYLDNPSYVIYSLNSPKAQEVKVTIGYTHFGWTDQIKAAYLIINGVSYKTPDKVLYGNHTGRPKPMGISNTITIPLVQGENNIRLVPVEKGTELPKFTEELGYGVIYPNGTADEDKAKTDTNVAGLYKSDGMIPNLDYIKFESAKPLSKGANTIQLSTLKISSENDNYGTVSASSTDAMIANGTEVTVTATAKTGYKFDCWSGTVGNDLVGSNNAEYKFNITGETTLIARFIPENYVNAGLEGYATISDDAGTKYTITGGFGGQEITISSLEDLKAKKSILSGKEPYTIKIAARIAAEEWIDTTEYTTELTKLKATLKTADNTEEQAEAEARFILDNRSLTFDIGSNKTLIGEAGQNYGFKNIQIKLMGSNVIVKNLHFGDVIGDDFFGGKGNDAMSIETAKNVWIDHCEFSSSIKPKDYKGNEIVFADHKFNVDLEGENTTEEIKWAKDFYDGLMDISEEARFISVSNSYFHDHWKACLCGGSNDNASTQPKGSQVRLTMYNNYFENVHARQPLFRFGKAHVYSSYFKGVEDGTSTGIEVRAESQVYVDDCYFEGLKAGREVGSWNSSSGLGSGTWVVENCTGTSATSNNTTYVPPYTWTKTSASDSKSKLLQGSAGIEK
ncbi:MAG: hypothetical protein KBT11_02845 [Treponema sp.]|nr:hypothetical protein [Candidatus Treponema equifaecale]